MYDKPIFEEPTILMSPRTYAHEAGSIFRIDQEGLETIQLKKLESIYMPDGEGWIFVGREEMRIVSLPLDE